MFLKKLFDIISENIEDKNLRVHFLRESNLIGLSSVKATCILGITFYLLFGFLDILIFPDQYFHIWILRIIVIGMCSIIYLFINTKLVKNNTQTIGMIMLLVSSLAIVTMCHMTGGPESIYYAGINLTFLIMIFILPLNAKRVIMVSMIVYAYYVFPAVVFGSKNYSIIVSNSFFLLTTMIIAIFGTIFKNKVRLNEIASRRDIEKVNEELRKLDTLKSNFFANVSHEVRTPLTSILAPAQTMHCGDAGQLTIDQNELVSQIYRNSLRLLDMINQMLDFSKIEAGKMNLRLDKINVDETVRDIVTMFDDVAERKGLMIRYLKEGELPLIYMDKDKIERIVTNLIRNSIKFTERGSIFVRLKLNNGYLSFEIEDTGIGIPADHLPHIFERFRQVDSSTTRKFEGTGLGLTIVKESVELLKGKISVFSEQGKGTRFKFELPTNLNELIPEALSERRTDQRRKLDESFTRDDKRKDHRRKEDFARISVEDLAFIDKQVSSNETNKSSEISAEPSHKVDRVLLIEDNTDLRMYISKMLTKFGHEVLTANDGQEGWERVQNELPDIIISDIMMPKMDGYELIKNVKGTSETMHIPIVLITAKPEIDSKIRGLETGADDYLPKPINIRELDARIKNLVTMRKFQHAVAKAEALDARMEELTISFAQSLETRDFKTAGHSKEVLDLGTMIARELNLSIDRKLKDSLLLHDIGKLGIPDVILLKEGRLTEDEWRIMRKHPEVGADLLNHFDKLKEISTIILAHQECYDGNGYPRGLKGEEIPLIARIIGVADAYHAMTNDRPYSKAMEPKAAITELIKFSGKQFDPKVIDAFIRGILKKGLITNQDIVDAKNMI